MHPIRSLPSFNHARETIFKRLEYSDVPCLEVQRWTSRYKHHLDLLADTLHLDILCYMRSHRIPHIPFPLWELRSAGNSSRSAEEDAHYLSRLALDTQRTPRRSSGSVFAPFQIIRCDSFDPVARTVSTTVIRIKASTVERKMTWRAPVKYTVSRRGSSKIIAASSIRSVALGLSELFFDKRHVRNRTAHAVISSSLNTVRVVV